jgi:hypothetical protein
MDIRDRAEGLRIWAGSTVLRNEKWQCCEHSIELWVSKKGISQINHFPLRDVLYETSPKTTLPSALTFSTSLIRPLIVFIGCFLFSLSTAIIILSITKLAYGVSSSRDDTHF